MVEIMWYLRSFRVPFFHRPIRMHIQWIEKDRRRDPDNVTSGGAKIILDAMKQLGVIQNDTRQWVKDIQHDTSAIDRENPRIEIEIREVL